MFSETVDLVIDRMGRGQSDLLSSATQYVNLTIQELALLNFYSGDMVEDEVPVPTGDNTLTWKIPVRFRGFRHVVYKPYWQDAHRLPPGPSNDRRRSYPYFYRAGQNVVFTNIGHNTSIGLAYYSYPKPLTYYAAGKRPAIFDFPNGRWMFYQADNNYVITGVSEADQVAKIDLVSNWILNDWQLAVAEGALAKLLKSRDDQRAPSTFAVYGQFRNMFRDTVFSESRELV